ncbi:MAG: Argininosuccinate lyase (EC [uncultured Campylobacterales bacterium]|uniref:Argininosuccinate lyase n=1 Tax=uncultured Campylobacterales bacterium TaxID=352960 RepID=A0A6S6SHH1_9BACT|nr:MAG: Argininosuccinate lyase (EC [uncultured Campylobacterales bacterium]
MSKLSSARLTSNNTTLLDEFNSSIMFDKELYTQDILGSITHAKMLQKQKILTKDEVELIVIALEKIRSEIQNDEFVFDIVDEDIHMAIEKRLTQLIGDTGKKLHTARSRNDQVALDLKLYTQTKNKEIISLLKTLIETLLMISDKHTNTILPGMTHLQHAQPVNFGFHLLTYISMFSRDIERFISSYKRNNLSPLGSAALAGTPHNIDRDFCANELGFDGPMINAMDGVSDRDFVLEILFNISVIGAHISRLSEELILWSSYEFGFVTFSDEYSTGSSIMPQKKNPDVAELLRGKTGRYYGNLMSMLTVIKGIPLAYNKDLQEDKEITFDSIKNISISLKILNESLKTLTINKENMKNATKVGHLSATDLADYLVSKGVAFRDAHQTTGRAVIRAEELGIDLSELSLEELQKIDSKIELGIEDRLNLENSMNARNSNGGTSTETTKEQIKHFQKFLKGLELERL